MFPGKQELNIISINFALTRLERLCNIEIQIKLKLTIEVLEQII
jgi:hypothetical protein